MVNFLSQYLLEIQITNLSIWLTRDHITTSLNQSQDFIVPLIIVIIVKSRTITFKTTGVNIYANPAIDNGVIKINKQTKIIKR